MRILIAEDDALISENLAIIVRSCGYKVAEIVQSMDEFARELEAKSFDIALLDIRMNGKDLGLEMADILNSVGLPFVYVTSFSDKSMLSIAIEHRPHGFILKPFNKIEIAEQLDKLSKSVRRHTVSLKCGGEMKLVRTDDITHMVSENVYVHVWLDDVKHVVRTKLTSLLEDISNENFIRTHQSFVVNINHVKSIGTKVVLHNNTEIPISRKFKTQLDSLFENRIV